MAIEALADTDMKRKVILVLFDEGLQREFLCISDVLLQGGWRGMTSHHMIVIN